MAFISAQVSRFKNTFILNEILGTGDGVQTVFNYTVLNPPVFLNSFTISYTIGSSNFQATSDSAGNITGTNISSGSVNEAGVMAITFTTAPDNTTNITIDSYTTKGMLQKFLEFITDGFKYVINETIYNGDGIQTIFSGSTLVNTPISKGAARLKFRIAGQDYYVWSNGDNNFVHLFLNSGSVNLTTGEIQANFTTAPDNSTTIDITYSYASVEGRDWIPLLLQNTKTNTGSDAYPGMDPHPQECILFNRGKGYFDIINVGIREFLDVGTNLFNWNINGYIGNIIDGQTNWNFNSIDHGKTSYNTSQEYYTLHPSMAFSDDSQVYWFYASKNRIAISAKVDPAIYVSGYFGFGLRLSPASKYPNPLYIHGCTVGGSNFTTTGSIYGFPVDNASVNGNTWSVDHENTYLFSNTTAPYPLAVNSTTPTTQTEDGDIIAAKIFIVDTIRKYSFFIIEGIVRFVQDTIQSEDQLDDGTNLYTVFQSGNKISQINYFAIKEA